MKISKNGLALGVQMFVCMLCGVSAWISLGIVIKMLAAGTCTLVGMSLCIGIIVFCSVLIWSIIRTQYQISDLNEEVKWLKKDMYKMYSCVTEIDNWHRDVDHRQHDRVNILNYADNIYNRNK